MNDLEMFFADSSRIVDEELDILIPEVDTEPARLHEAIRWSLFAGGKRFRPVLVFAAGRTFDADEEKLVRTAAAVEMIHTYSLIHDDLPSMDNDDLRRGRETCHKKFDEATAILAGDVLETLAFQAVAEDETLTADLRIKLISELARSAGTPLGMVAGQQLDLEAEGKDITVEAVNKIHSLKTGSLIAASGKAGAMIGGGEDFEIAAIEGYSTLLGLLFQITDDLLDITETTESLGKTAGKDVAASKATFPKICGVEQSRILARSIFNRSVECLEPLGRPSTLLVSLAEFILRRTN